MHFTKQEREVFQSSPHKEGWKHSTDKLKETLGIFVPQVKERKCLRCDKKFQSDDYGVRKCWNCRRSAGIEETI